MRQTDAPTLGRLVDQDTGPAPELSAAVDWFGRERALTEILPDHVRTWLRTLAPADRERHRRALARTYRHAQERGAVPVGFDPSSVVQHLACPGDQLGIHDFVRTYRRASEGHPA